MKYVFVHFVMLRKGSTSFFINFWKKNGFQNKLIHFKTDRDDSISLTFELEKKLWRNALFEQKGDAMGIFFSRNGMHDLWQVLCSQCAYMTDTGPTVIDEVFTVAFHRRYGNIDASENVNTTDLFDQAKLLASEAIRDYRLGHLF